MRNIITKILLPVLIILFLISCNENPTSAQKGPDTTSHKFTWTVDTLTAPDAWQILIDDIWGTDENNVWAVGHSDDYDYQIWHWDGETWKNISPVLQNIRPSYHQIHGFSEDDIWIVGRAIYQYDADPAKPHRRFVFHYDGTEWVELDTLLAPAARSIVSSGIEISPICGI